MRVWPIALLGVAASAMCVGAPCAWAADPVGPGQSTRSYVVVGTGQSKCYDDRTESAPPKPGQAFYGQDAQHPGPAASYRDNGDGTVSDHATGWCGRRPTAARG
jgi:hypothetical protein